MSGYSRSPARVALVVAPRVYPWLAAPWRSLARARREKIDSGRRKLLELQCGEANHVADRAFDGPIVSTLSTLILLSTLCLYG